MTYSSCWVEIVEFNAVGLGETTSERTEMLRQPVKMYWLPTLKKWETARNLEIDYVDNSWIRVDVGRSDLMDFLQTEVVNGEALVPKIEASENFRYVLVAEEF